MNIFVLDKNFQKCAEYHTDKHVVKMILESVQLLSSAVRLFNIDAGYKLTHINHPCSIWVRESLSNWLWLQSLVEALHKEWQYRFNHIKNHKSYDVMHSLPIPPIDDIGLTNFALAMPDIYKKDCPITSYRTYYIGEKQHLFKWTKREIPKWLI